MKTNEQLLIEQLQRERKQLVTFNTRQKREYEKLALKLREAQRKIQSLEREKKLLETQLRQQEGQQYV